MPDFPALPSYLTGDGLAPPPQSQPSGLPPLPSYLGGPQPPPAQTASASASQDPNADQLMQLAKAHGKPQLGDYLARQGAERAVGPVEKPPDTGIWTAAKGAASSAFGMPLAGGAETLRDWAAQHPTLAGLILGPSGKEAIKDVPEGLTHELKGLSDEQRQAFLAAHPGTGGAAAEFATELGTNLLPMVAGIAPALRSVATGAAGNVTLRSALMGAAKTAPLGAAIGAPLGYAASYGAPTGERLGAAGQGALLLGGLAGIGGLGSRPALPAYLSGEHPLPAGGALRLPQEGPSAPVGAPISPEAVPSPAPGEVAPPPAAGPGGRLGVPTRVDPAVLAANRRAGPQPTATTNGAFGHVQVEAPGEEATAALAAHVQAAAHEVAPGRAIHDGDAVLLGANDEAGLFQAAAAAQERLAAHPVVVTHPDGTTYEHPIHLAEGAPDVPSLPAGADALAERVFPAQGLLAAAHEPGAGGPASAAGPPPGLAPAGLHNALQGLAARAGEAGPAQAGGGALPGQVLGEAPAGAAELQTGGHGAQGAGPAGAEAAQPEGRPGTEGAVAPGAEAAGPPPHGGGAEGQTLRQAGVQAERDAASEGQRWFTSSLAGARQYAQEAGEGSRVFYTDVPRAAYERLSREPALYGEGEDLVLPRELSQQAAPVEGAPRPAASAVRLYRGLPPEEAAARTAAPEVKSGEAGFVRNPMAPTPAERGWRQYYPLRRSFVAQEGADRLAAQWHEYDLMHQFPDPELRRQMSLAVERNDPMQAPAEQAVRDHPQGGAAAMAEIERQRQQGQVNMKGLRDLGFVPKDVPDVEDYIRHEWDPVRGAPRQPYSAGRSYESQNTSVLQEREFPTLGTGLRAGRTPTTLDYATMVRNGDQEFSHTLALHRLMQDVSEIRFMGDGHPAYLRTTSKAPDTLQRLGAEGYRDVSGIPLLNRAIPGDGTLYMHRNLWDNLSPILRDSPTTPIGRAVDTALGFAKQMLLGFSFFHPAELTIQHALQRGVTPALWEGLKRGFGVPWLNQLTQKMGWGNLERETWMQAAQDGVNFTSPETDTNMIQVQKTLGALARRMGMEEGTAGGKVAGVAGKILASPHEAMFPGYMAPLKVLVQTVNRDKLMRLRAGDDWAMGPGGFLNRKSLRALSDDDAIGQTAGYTNNAFGGQSTRLFVNRLAADPMAQKVFSRAFLAPDWFTSGAKLMAAPLSHSPVSRALGINMYGRLALQTFVGLNLANYALTRAFSPTGRGHFMIDNEPGKETQLQTGPNEFMNVMKLQRELPDVVGKERVSNAIGAFAHAGPQGEALEWLRQPHGPWPGADEPVATSHFHLTDPSWRETPVLSTIGNKVNPLPNAAFGELSGHYLSGYPTDLTKAQEKAQQRGTFDMPKAEWQYRLQTAGRPFAPIPGSKLADTDQPLTAGEVAKQLMVPFQLSKGLNFYTARPQLADAYRKGDQQTVDEITAILRSHIDPRDPAQAAIGERKLQMLLHYAQRQSRSAPYPPAPTGSATTPEVAAAQ